MVFKKAPPQGFEPWTYGLEIRCSIQLSYEGNVSKVIEFLTLGHSVWSVLRKPNLRHRAKERSPAIQKNSSRRF